MAFALTSPNFVNEQGIPTQFTGEGADLSPELAWTDAPASTAGFALICDDPDAPSAEPWVHWLIYNIPARVEKLPKNIARKPRLDDFSGVTQGRNSWNRIGYGGPLPPSGHGPHHYYFTLFALNQTLNLQPGLTKAELLPALRGHILAQTTLVGIYERGVQKRAQ